MFLPGDPIEFAEETERSDALHVDSMFSTFWLKRCKKGYFWRYKDTSKRLFGSDFVMGCKIVTAASNVIASQVACAP